MKTYIWRLTWSHALGVIWLQVRATTDDLAEHWLNVFRADEPTALYVAAPKKPPVRPDQEHRALHIATF